MREIFHNRKANFVGSIFLLAAFLCAALLPPVFAAEPRMPETVYCPLTHQFQPIKLQKPDAFRSLDEICANDDLKNKFAVQLAGELTVKSLELNSAQVTKLAFNFWRSGKSAFDSAPLKPNQNEQLAAKNSFFAVVPGTRDESLVIFKIAQKFVFQTKPRPPTVEFSAAFDLQKLQTLEKISRRIVPRAPPIFS